MYDYSLQRAMLFTDDGQRLFLKVRDRTNALLAQSGAVMMEKATATCTGDSWDFIACLDRMVELGDILEVRNEHSRAGQHRIFIKAFS